MSVNIASVEPSFGCRLTGLGTVILTVRVLSELLTVPPSEVETHLVTNTETVQKTLLESDRLRHSIRHGAIPVFPIDIGLPNRRPREDPDHIDWLPPRSFL